MKKKLVFPHAVSGSGSLNGSEAWRNNISLVSLFARSQSAYHCGTTCHSKPMSKVFQEDLTHDSWGVLVDQERRKRQ